VDRAGFEPNWVQTTPDERAKPIIFVSLFKGFGAARS
jgi:hypothetical protein